MNSLKQKKYKKLSLEKKQARYGILFISPLLIGFLIFIPNMVQTFVFSLNDIVVTPYHLVFQGFKYYHDALLVNAEFNRYLVTSLQQLCTNIPVIVIFSLFIATLLNQKFKGRIVARAIFFIPVLLATGIITKVETASNLMNILDTSRTLQTGTSMDAFQLNQINNLLLSLNFSPFLINIVAGAANSIYNVVLSSGIQIFIFLAGLQEIPDTVYEAAKVEGCSGWELFWKITFPMISPQIIVNSIYTIVDTFTKPNNMLFDYINGIAFGQGQYGYATAMYWIYFLCIGSIIAIVGFAMSRFVYNNNN